MPNATLTTKIKVKKNTYLLKKFRRVYICRMQGTIICNSLIEKWQINKSECREKSTIATKIPKIASIQLIVEQII